LASTGNGLDLRPYWSEQSSEISSTLWLPTGTGWLDSALSLWQCSSSTMAGQSWFKTLALEAPSKNELRLSWPSSTSAVAECTEEGGRQLQKKVVRIRLYPTIEQRALLRKWFGTSRYVYNRTIEYLRQPRTIANWKDSAKQIFAELPEWSKETFYSPPLRSPRRAYFQAYLSSLQTQVSDAKGS
jgi:putative transposase